MTTSANFNTPDRIIRMAMKDAGLLQEGDDPNSEQFADGLNRLNDIINFEQTQGLKLWLQYDLEVPLVAGQGTYTIGSGGDIDMTKPTRVLNNGYYLDVNSIRRPLIMFSRDEFLRLSNPTGQGPVTSFFTDKQRAQLAITFWLIPDTQAATGTVHLLIQQQMTNMVSLTDTMSLPQEWFMWARWALANDLSSGQPLAVQQRCMSFASAYREALEDWDVEDASTSFAPDQRASYTRGAFR